MKKLFYFIVTSIIIYSCSNSIKPSKSVSIEPSEEILHKYANTDFSIVLDDMKIDEKPDFMVYKHKYKVLTLENDSLRVKEIPWKTVNKKFFKDHENDLGMEIVSRHNGKVSKVAQPVGFGWAIGNEKHGEWENVQNDSTKVASSHNSSSNSNSNHNRRWRTHSTSPFFWYWMLSRRSTYRSDYNGYRTNYNSGRPYYGNKTSSGSYTYGTRSNYQSTNRKSFFTRKAQNASKWNNLYNRSSRSSSRYSNGSSTRSRSGGYGK